MSRDKVETFKYVREMNELLTKNGIFLVAEGMDKKPNTMTIGWGFLGTMWSKPICIVAVRHSRHTFKLMEEAKSWTVCIPAKGMEAALDFCGTKSGRDHDKFLENRLTPVPSRQVRPPIIQECVVHYECRTLHRNDLAPDTLAQAVQDEFYAQGDYHRVYFGEIVAVRAEEGFRE